MVTSNAAVSSQSYDQLCILRKSHVNLIEALAPQADKKVRLCAAVLIDYKHHWQEWKLKVHRTPWIYQKLKNIHKDLMGLYSLHVIRAAIELLIRLGLLERRSNPGNGQDKTYQYRLRWDKVQAAIAKQSNPVEVKVKVKKNSEPLKFRSESPEFTVERHQQLQSIAIRSNSLKEEGEIFQEINQEEEPSIVITKKQVSDDNKVKIEESSTTQIDLNQDEFSAPPAQNELEELNVNYKGVEEEICDNEIEEDLDKIELELQGNEEAIVEVEEEYEAPPRPRKAKNLNSRQSKVCSAFLLDEPVFVQWWVNRLLKTKFGTEELVLAPDAFVKASIRKNPQQALDMWESFKAEMSKRLENFKTRVEHGCQISALEKEQIKAIAPYATVTESPLVQKALLPEAPEGAENADAYRLYKPSEKEVAPPPEGFFQEAMAKLMAKMSMPKGEKVKEKPVLSELEKLNIDIKEPILRPEVMRRVMGNDAYIVDFDEEGIPYRVRRA
jgi:hypothetical protein